MICIKCGKVFKDFSSEKGTCIACRVKEFGEMPAVAMPKEDIANATLVYRTDIVGRKTTENVSRHMEICDELNKLYEKKNNDYGDSFSGTFREFGLTMSAIRLQDKLERFKRLSKGNEANVKDESIRDTLVDLANYAIMTVMEIDKNGKK